MRNASNTRGALLIAWLAFETKHHSHIVCPDIECVTLTANPFWNRRTLYPLQAYWQQFHLHVMQPYQLCLSLLLLPCLQSCHDSDNVPVGRNRVTIRVLLIFNISPTEKPLRFSCFRVYNTPVATSASLNSFNVLNVAKLAAPTCNFPALHDPASPCSISTCNICGNLTNCFLCGFFCNLT